MVEIATLRPEDGSSRYCVFKKKNCFLQNKLIKIFYDEYD